MLIPMTGFRGLGVFLLLPFQRFASQLRGRDERQVCLYVRNEDVEDRKNRKKKEKMKAKGIESTREKERERGRQRPMGQERKM